MVHFIPCYSDQELYSEERYHIYAYGSIYSATKKKKRYILSMNVFCVYKNKFEVSKIKIKFFSFLISKLNYTYIFSVI